VIVVDTSAIVAILESEPERSLFAQIIGNAVPAYASVVTVQEAAMVMYGRHGQVGLDGLWQFLADAGITIALYDEQQLRVAITAFTRYGKGMGTPAKLNMGDCASYALAKIMNAPLLYKGNDFAATDIVAAV
jgi:ribonuclease VapC